MHHFSKVPGWNAVDSWIYHFSEAPGRNVVDS